MQHWPSVKNHPGCQKQYYGRYDNGPPPEIDVHFLINILVPNITSTNKICPASRPVLNAANKIKIN